MELYGEMDPQTRDWTDGILSYLFKIANQDTPEGRQRESNWILFDGDVDAVWVENMNSVMDDNKILTLSNGDRIRLRDNCKLLFEVYNLAFASPATISRCGMVFLDTDSMTIQSLVKKWCSKYSKIKLESEEILGEYVFELFE